MKKYCFSIAAIAIFITITSCNDAKQKNEKKGVQDVQKNVEEQSLAGTGAGSFSITAPDGWIKKDSLIEGIKITTISSPIEGPGDNFKENVNIITEPARGYSLTAYTGTNLENIKSQRPDFNILSDENVELDAVPARAIIYTLKYGNYNLKNLVYVLVKNDIGYIITCATLDTKFDKFEPAFTACVKSFKLNN